MGFFSNPFSPLPPEHPTIYSLKMSSTGLYRMLEKLAVVQQDEARSFCEFVTCEMARDVAIADFVLIDYLEEADSQAERDGYMVRGSRRPYAALRLQRFREYQDEWESGPSGSDLFLSWFGTARHNIYHDSSNSIGVYPSFIPLVFNFINHAMIAIIQTATMHDSTPYTDKRNIGTGDEWDDFVLRMEKFSIPRDA